MYEADMPKAAQEISPIDSALQSLNKEQEATHQILDKLQARLSVLLRAQPPSADASGANISQAPESELHERIMSRRDCAVGLNRRITDLIQRLTV